MATIVSTPTAAEFFVQTDPYRWDVDNRPLQHLLDNDVAINAELESVRDEVHTARIGLLSTYPTLDDRLDAMENAIGQTVSISDMEDMQGHQYGDFIAASEANRRACPSGFLDHNGIGDLVVGDSFDDFASIFTTTALGSSYPNTVVLWTQWGSGFKPIRAMVNGWIVRLWNEKMGSPATVPANHVVLDLGNAPNSGKNSNFVFLEVWLEQVDKSAPTFYKYGAENSTLVPATVTDHLSAEAIHSVRAMAVGGDWIQLRHRFRMVADIDPESNPDGFDTTAIFAQGAQSTPVNTYAFTNMAATLDDAGLWRAGAGDSTSKTELGTYDGYVYAIPVLLAHRRNTLDYEIGQQNGSKVVGNSTSGYLSTGLSGRPDGLFYDQIDQRDILDLRRKVSLSGFNLKAELQRSWQMLIRGELRTNIKELKYDINNDSTWEGTDVWGHTITVVDRIANNVDPLNPANYMRDKAVSPIPLSSPDSVRTKWSRNAITQPVKFSFTQGSNGSITPSAFITYNSASNTLTFNANTLSGAGTGGTHIETRAPVIMKKDDLSSKPTLITTGLGTPTATTVMSGLAGGASYVGYIYVVYPGGSGLAFPHKRILAVDVWDGGVTRYQSQQFGITGSSGVATSSYTNRLSSPRSVGRQSTGHYIVCDTGANRVVRIDPSTWAITHQFGVNGVSGSDNTHLNAPSSAFVDSDDKVYICDSLNNRILKLDSTLSSILATFGASAPLAGSGVDSCHFPRYATADATYLYFTDQENHRVVKINKTTFAYVSMFGAAGNNKGSLKLGLNYPTGITLVSATGAGKGVWVADRDNKRVVVLDETTMAFKFQISSKNVPNSVFDQEISDVAVDDNGNMYVSIAKRHVVKKYNSSLTLVAQIGVDGVTGTSTHSTNITYLNWPLGLALSTDMTSYLFVCDNRNHRVIRIDLVGWTLAGQFGRTGVDQPDNKTFLENEVCQYPFDVAADENGYIYIAQAYGRVIRVNSATWARTHTHGVLGTPTRDISDNNLFGNCKGIAVKKDGSKVAVIDQQIVDPTNDVFQSRVVFLAGSNLAYQAYFEPKYDTSVLNRRYAILSDIEYSPYDDSTVTGGGDDGHWYVCAYELALGKGAPLFQYFSIMRFTDSPAGTATAGSGNWITAAGGHTPGRFVTYDFTTGICLSSTNVYATTQTHGIAIHDKITPTTYEFTNDPLLNVYFNMIQPLTLSTSNDGTKVLLTEPNIHTVHCFDSVSAIYIGSAGIPFSSGDDAAKLNTPLHAIMHDKYLVIVDRDNHRLLRRHISAPWISQDGTVSVMVAPAATDKLDAYYEQEAYQGGLLITNAVWKSQIIEESNCLYASTLGLGLPLISDYAGFDFLKGMTARLPLPYGWTDYSVSPVGMKIGTVDGDDDGPFLALPITTTEGFMGGQTNITQAGDSTLSSKQKLQQIVRLITATQSPVVRGYRTVLPGETPVPTGTTVRSSSIGISERLETSSIRQFTDPNAIHPSTQITYSDLYLQGRTTIIRNGCPPVRSYNLLEAVPHFTYFPFFYVYRGAVYLGVIAQGSNDKTVRIGDYTNNAVDSFFPHARILVR